MTRRRVGPQPRLGERGVTLVELLVTMTIVGIAFTALLGSLSAMFMNNDSHRKVSYAQTLLRRYAEQLQAASYVDCATTSTSAYTAALAPVPASYAASLQSVTYWNGDSAATFNSNCAGGDKGVQRITLRVQQTDSVRPVTKDLVVVKRDPS
jgi:prepilin-type N-terminal cleavage/methylation domain-containing protein